MEKIAENGEPVEKASRLRKILALIAPYVFVVFSSTVSNYFKPYISFPIFFFFWFLLFGLIQFWLEKKKNERLNFKALSKWIGIYTLAMLVLYNVVNLMTSTSAIVPDSISQWFPLILVTGSVLFLIGYAFHFLQKHTKI